MHSHEHADSFSQVFLALVGEIELLRWCKTIASLSAKGWPTADGHDERRVKMKGVVLEVVQRSFAHVLIS